MGHCYLTEASQKYSNMNRVRKTLPKKSSSSSHFPSTYFMPDNFSIAFALSPLILWTTLTDVIIHPHFPTGQLNTDLGLSKAQALRKCESFLFSGLILSCHEDLKRSFLNFSTGRVLYVCFMGYIVLLRNYMGQWTGGGCSLWRFEVFEGLDLALIIVFTLQITEVKIANSTLGPSALACVGLFNPMK